MLLINHTQCHYSVRIGITLPGFVHYHYKGDGGEINCEFFFGSNLKICPSPFFLKKSCSIINIQIVHSKQKK